MIFETLEGRGGWKGEEWGVGKDEKDKRDWGALATEKIT